MIHGSMPEPLDRGAVVFGEIGLAGEIRPVSQSATRMKEAAKLGFTHALAPEPAAKGKGKGGAAIEVRGLAHVRDLVALFPDALTHRSS